MSDSESEGPSKLFYALLSVTIVSLASLLGGIILPCTTGKSRRLWMHFFIAMAVGTLSSDSILHLIPEVLGIHDHSHAVHTANETTTTISPLPFNESDHNDSHEDDHHHRMRRHSHEGHEGHHDHHHNEEGNEMRKERQMLLKLLCLLCAVYILYLIEFVAYFRTDGGGHSHGHSHGTAEVNQLEVYTEKPIPVWDIESSCSPSSSSTSVGPPLNQVSPLLAAPPVFCGLRGPALIILFGDGVHNFIDGVAIGASFASSFGTGVATSIAVLCHELPHELGDMAVLLETGLSMSRALLLNLLSALTAYAGLFVGFYAVSIDSAKTWLLALTAGMFLYVAWIDMLSHLKHEAAERLDPWWLTCLLQFAGLFFGTSIMFALGWFEHDLFSDNH